LGKTRIKEEEEEEDKALLSFGRRWWSVSSRSSVSLCEKAHPPPTTHQSFHPRRRRHPTKKKRRVVPFRSVPFLTDRTQKNGRRRRRPQELNNLFEKRSSFSSRFNCCLVIAFDSSTKKPQNTLGSLRTEEEEEGE
jgi:hypothetical protein